MDKKTKIIAISLIAMVFAISIVAAETQGQATIHKLGVLGRGLAINPSDASDFKLVVIGIATVRVNILGEYDDVTAGILWLNGERYKLKNINIGNGSATADVYKNDTKVGSITAASVTKDGHIVWHGTLNLNGVDWNLYILELERKIKADELKDKVSDYCKDHTGEGNCQFLRGKVEEYCKNNPDDARCKEIFINYCINNLDDSRCRNAVKERCEDAPNATICQRLEVKVAKRFCDENPNDERCIRIRQIINRHPAIDDDDVDEDDLDDDTTTTTTANLTTTIQDNQTTSTTANATTTTSVNATTTTTDSNNTNNSGG